MWEMEFAFMHYENAEWKYSPLGRTLLNAGWEPFAVTHESVKIIQGATELDVCTVWFRRKV